MGADATLTDWKALKILFVYRFFLAVMYVSLFFSEFGLKYFGAYDRTLFGATCLSYLAIIFLSALGLHFQKPRFVIQSNTLTVIDITTIILLMHANGGVQSSFGILLVITIASIGLLASRRMALFHPAIATLALFFQTFYASLTSSQPTSAYTSVAILGFTLFVTGLLTQALSERVKQSEALAKQRGVDLASMEELNERIIRSMRSGVIALDKQNQIALINDAAVTLLKCTHAHAGDTLHKIAPELDAHLQQWRQNPNRPKQSQFDLHGTSLHLQISCIDNLGSYRMAILMEDNVEIAQRLQQMKLASLGRLTASIAHEIRNPLSAISHANQLLNESSQLHKSDQRMIEIIQKNALRVNTIIENVLQLSRRSKTQPQTIMLFNWLQDFTEEFMQRNGLTQQELHLSVIPQDMIVHFDPSQLHQVLTNLANNSVLYGRNGNGEITLRITASGQEERPFLTFEDQGPGISQEHVRHLFEPFFTIKNAGTGLGLYIAKELSECNYAKLEFIPTPPPGTCFRITFTVKEGLES